MRAGTTLTTALLALALAGCTAAPVTVSPAPPPPAADAADVSDTPTPSAPVTVDLPATVPAPELARETVGSDAPGTDAQFGELVTALLLAYPAQYIEGEWRADEVPHARVVLLGPVTGELRQLLEAAPLAVEVVTTAGPSLEESNAAIGRVVELVKTHDAGMSLSGGYEQLEQRYSIDYTAATPIDGALVSDALGGAAVRLSWLGTEPAVGTGAQAEAL